MCSRFSWFKIWGYRFYSQKKFREYGKCLNNLKSYLTVKLISALSSKTCFTSKG